MNQEQVRSNETVTGTDRKLKTRCYYTDYVQHMVRFYLSTPETLSMEGRRKADIENWLAVQDVLRHLNTTDRQMLEDVYRLHHKLPEGVRIYCEKTGADPYTVWVLITKTNSRIAKRRCLI